MQNIDSSDQAICSDVSLAGDVIAYGFSDSTVRVWIYKCTVLPTTEESEEEEEEQDENSHQEPDSDEERKLEFKKLVDREKHLKISDLTTEEVKFVGHTGAVYGVSISYDSHLLLSCSHDTTIRLWRIPTSPVIDPQTALVVFKNHIRPVWTVKFSPFGFYFASGSADKTANLWVTSKNIPERLFKGHFTDVEAVEFHPNLQYLATAGNDQTIRLWSIYSANCVRILITNSSPTRCLRFSNSGKHLFSTNDRGNLSFYSYFYL